MLHGSALPGGLLLVIGGNVRAFAPLEGAPAALAGGQLSAAFGDNGAAPFQAFRESDIGFFELGDDLVGIFKRHNNTLEMFPCLTQIKQFALLNSSQPQRI